MQIGPVIHSIDENLKLKEDLHEARKALEQNNSLHDLINMKKIRRQNKEKILIKDELIGMNTLLKTGTYISTFARKIMREKFTGFWQFGEELTVAKLP